MILDASEHMFGYRLDGREVRDVTWDGATHAVAAEWGEEFEHQVHREMGAVLQTLQRIQVPVQDRIDFTVSWCAKTGVRMAHNG